ncbi:PXA domain-containing protein [Aspergillus ambiguus]|uniref:PX domain protein n=1 Tax=Aspergillus ambiguus TaxID=176160 RepID=UPI003CCE4749
MDASSDDKPTLREERSSTDTPTAGEKDTKPILPKDVIDAILHFFAHSSNEVLLGTFAALLFATYIILGRLGLLLIGIAGGVTLHATWEGTDHGATGGSSDDRNSRRRELALNVANRLLDWPRRTSRDNATTSDALQDSTEYTSIIDFDSISPPETAAALRTLTDAVIRDYVNYWYGPILPSDIKFPLSCRRVLTGFIGNVSSHLSRKRTADAFLEFLTNSSSMIIVFLNELSTAFQAVGTSMSPEQTVRRYLELSPESSLANVLAEAQQQRKLNMIADDILSSFLDQKAYDCPPVRDFLREILAGVVLESIVTSLSRPEFINGWIIYLCSEGESEIMNAIDAGVESARTQGVSSVKDSTDVNTIMRTPTDAAEGDLNSARSTNAPTDKATEEAIKEAKRLSAMIAAHTKPQDPISTLDGGEPYSKSSDELGGVDQGVRNHQTLGATENETAEASLEKEISQPNGRLSSQSTRVPLDSPSSPNLPSELPPALYGASISVDDGSEPGGKATLRSKPTSEYLLQVEPSSARSTGWMVFRKYADFESLHEALETISRLNRIGKFAEDHPVLPPWKGQTKQGLVKQLERYLQDALQYEPLAESARMRRFLEKDGGPGPDSNGTMKSGFSFPSQAAFENVGKGVLGVLSNAPKGVSGVFGPGTGDVKKPLASPDLSGSAEKLAERREAQTPSLRSSEDDQYGKVGAGSQDPLDVKAEQVPAIKQSRTTDSPSRESVSSAAQGSTDGNSDVTGSSVPEVKGGPTPRTSSEQDETATTSERTAATVKESPRTRSSPITQDETRIAVELIFAVINELYTLSSAWNIRRTLLNAAKSYILRPGNPNLETIRGLLQESMIDANTTDETIAFYLLKMRENALPTEAELKAWPPPPDDAEKERLRDSARKALAQRGLPQALTSVMGAAASREALEKVFDCLQYEPIARGFVFSVLLQALRAVIL